MANSVPRRRSTVSASEIMAGIPKEDRDRGSRVLPYDSCASCGGPVTKNKITGPKKDFCDHCEDAASPESPVRPPSFPQGYEDLEHAYGHEINVAKNAIRSFPGYRLSTGQSSNAAISRQIQQTHRKFHFLVQRRADLFRHFDDRSNLVGDTPEDAPERVARKTAEESENINSPSRIMHTPKDIPTSGPFLTDSALGDQRIKTALQKEEARKKAAPRRAAAEKNRRERKAVSADLRTSSELTGFDLVALPGRVRPITSSALPLSPAAFDRATRKEERVAKKTVKPPKSGKTTAPETEMVSGKPSKGQSAPKKVKAKVTKSSEDWMGSLVEKALPITDARASKVLVRGATVVHPKYGVGEYLGTGSGVKKDPTSGEKVPVALHVFKYPQSGLDQHAVPMDAPENLAQHRVLTPELKAQYDAYVKSKFKES